MTDAELEDGWCGYGGGGPLPKHLQYPMPEISWKPKDEQEKYLLIMAIIHKQFNFDYNSIPSLTDEEQKAAIKDFQEKLGIQEIKIPTTVVLERCQ